MRAQIDATISDHSAFIDALEGPAKVAKIINSLCQSNVQTSHVSMMRQRRIPWYYRPALAHAAKERGIPLPAGFLGYVA